MKLQLFLLILRISLNFIYAIDYELEFLDEKVYRPCENYPDNFLDRLFNISTLDYGKTEDGSITVNGYTTVRTTVEGPLPFSIEVFKKVRGTWQPTMFNLKRKDSCTAAFSKMELWYSYFKNIPDEQKTCPLTEGQRFDFDVNEPAIMSLPVRNAEGEYKIQAKVSTENGDVFVCVDIFAIVYKI